MAIKSVLLTGLLGVLLGTAGCATTEPFPVVAQTPAVNAVRNDVSGHQHQSASWGGTILGTEVKQDATLVRVLARPLDSEGRPRLADQSDGRFIARFKGFADPAVFTTGRRLSVTGSITGSETRKIGDYFYVYPVLDVIQYRLWPVEIRVRRDPDYWWYDPWYYPYPWYPWYPVYTPPPSPPSPPRPPPTKK